VHRPHHYLTVAVGAAVQGQLLSLDHEGAVLLQVLVVPDERAFRHSFQGVLTDRSVHGVHQAERLAALPLSFRVRGQPVAALHAAPGQVGPERPQLLLLVLEPGHIAAQQPTVGLVAGQRASH